MASLTNFNLITEAEALAALDKVDDLNGGVVQQIDGSRAYVPEYGGGWAPPVDGENKMYMVDFANGRRCGLGLIHKYYNQYLGWYKDPKMALEEVRRIVRDN